MEAKHCGSLSEPSRINTEQQWLGLVASLKPAAAGEQWRGARAFPDACPGTGWPGGVHPGGFSHPVPCQRAHKQHKGAHAVKWTETVESTYVFLILNCTKQRYFPKLQLRRLSGRSVVFPVLSLSHKEVTAIRQDGFCRVPLHSCLPWITFLCT